MYLKKITCKTRWATYCVKLKQRLREYGTIKHKKLVIR